MITSEKIIEAPILGFGWTGSGAVIDYAFNYDGVQCFKNYRGETSFLKGKYSLSNALNMLSIKGCLDVGFFNELVFYLKGDEGISETVFPSREKVNIKRNEQLRYQLQDSLVMELDNFAARVLAFSNCKTINISHTLFLKESKQLLKRLKMHAVEKYNKDSSGKIRYLIINNDPAGYSIDSFKFHNGDNTRFTVVSRSAMDVFANLALRGKYHLNSDSVRHYFKVTLKKYEQFVAGVLNLTDVDLKIINFEDFIHSELIRKRWKEYIGIVSSVQVDTSFNAEKSKVKINMWQESLLGFLSLEDISLLQRLETERQAALGRILKERPDYFLF